VDRLHSMRVFARVVDEGSFAAAARKLDLSPAVVTRLVADLEEHLGARLMNRTTRHLSLTDVGEAYLGRIRHVLTELDEAEALATASNTEPRGQVRILCPAAFAVHQLAKHLKWFRDQYPLVSIELSVAGPLATVDDDFDVTILTEGQRKLDGAFIARKLARSEVIICAAPEYLDRFGRPAHPRELAGHEVMMPSYLRELTLQTRGTKARRGETFSIDRLTTGLTTSHTDTFYAAALAGMGITGLPSFVAADALLENALERVLPQWHLQSATLYAGMPTRKYVPTRTRVFVDFLVTTFGGEDRDPWLAAAGCETLPNPTRRKTSRMPLTLKASGPVRSAGRRGPP
jgi:DNA-binding transcriptional LysR family regulator